MTMLVLGSAGQVGHEILRLAGERRIPVAAPDRAELDITDASAVRRAIAGPDVVVNAAAYTDVDGAEREPDAAFAVNRDGAANVAAACAAAGAPLIHLSTDYVFDGEKPSAYREDDPAHPLSVYGRSKATGEDAIRAALGRHVILRTAWVFSARRRNFVRSIIAAASRQSALDVVDDQRGGPTAAADIAGAVLDIAAALRRPFAAWGTYHYCGAPVVSRYEFAQAILRGRPEVALRPVSSSRFPAPAARPKNAALDCTRIRAAFGIAQPRWQPALDAVLKALA